MLTVSQLERSLQSDDRRGAGSLVRRAAQVAGTALPPQTAAGAAGDRQGSPTSSSGRGSPSSGRASSSSGRGSPRMRRASIRGKAERRGSGRAGEHGVRRRAMTATAAEVAAAASVVADGDITSVGENGKELNRSFDSADAVKAPSCHKPPRPQLVARATPPPGVAGDDPLETLRLSRGIMSARESLAAKARIDVPGEVPGMAHVRASSRESHSRLSHMQSEVEAALSARLLASSRLDSARVASLAALTHRIKQPGARARVRARRQRRGRRQRARPLFALDSSDDDNDSDAHHQCPWPAVCRAAALSPR
ncbi:uncharacterized protein AMSG_09928 [Thecamonas trahens ATCC 50062]|uniref:Uncharacterized protein n=1 Tax=Thecamonas trahens ATCC 50062 TaxID=461836 RepID=A0A0L0DPB7_THETB|nr:hypothetical protein AMSG_09928 [Thecamonas trahens ATCC 50062]KNC54149.1 hypothetical protein AMSG_09928 [Thecamonas trahens ATCC 50062]|eukprot:XP_013753970.1 hypothetical protein AMSG_09928 [Thecamonas trahens ATCC 50062]